ncbi:MAG: YbaK/EbsC family protein [Verrucomicrobia bacterium]|nr:YbaK/EbsC family protein [Verrucomicrobiota bacterium]MBS0638147.1 YbaK/EbsC family protein [Verrucomicrobiota bacterium]
MHNVLSKSSRAVQEALEQKGLTCKVVELTSSTRTANDAAATIGCEVGQIVKSLLFRTKQTNLPVLILVSGKNRVDEKAIELVIGEKIEKADAAFTREITGFAIGGIPPVGHSQKIEHVFIDQDLFCYETVWAAAGTPFAVFSMPSTALAKVSDGKILAINQKNITI